jgi:hypothetical protein
VALHPSAGSLGQARTKVSGRPILAGRPGPFFWGVPPAAARRGGIPHGVRPFVQIPSFVQIREVRWRVVFGRTEDSWCPVAGKGTRGPGRSATNASP